MLRWLTLACRRYVRSARKREQRVASVQVVIIAAHECPAQPETENGNIRIDAAQPSTRRRAHERLKLRLVRRAMAPSAAPFRSGGLLMTAQTG
jgi:hypothetical protein